MGRGGVISASVNNVNIFRVMLIGAMLITLLTLMNHPLFEWSLRPKLTSLNNNFALIIKVISGTIQIFDNNLSFFRRSLALLRTQKLVCTSPRLHNLCSIF